MDRDVLVEDSKRPSPVNMYPGGSWQKFPSTSFDLFIEVCISQI